MNKVLSIHKPIGWTSFDVVKKIRVQVKPFKVGHAGSLDPFAEGVLVLCIGNATKKVESLMDHEKEYIAEIKLGIGTDTLDHTGKVIEESNIPKLSKVGIENVLSEFLGSIQQIPPMYSALKHNGERLYNLARKGISVERQSRTVFIKEIKLLEINYDKIRISICCGRGTYIRTLAMDIARKLNTVGHLQSLIRTRVGNYTIDSSIPIEKFSEWISLQA